MPLHLTKKIEIAEGISGYKISTSKAVAREFAEAKTLGQILAKMEEVELKPRTIKIALARPSRLRQLRPTLRLKLKSRVGVEMVKPRSMKLKAIRLRKAISVEVC